MKTTLGSLVGSIASLLFALSLAGCAPGAHVSPDVRLAPIRTSSLDRARVVEIAPHRASFTSTRIDAVRLVSDRERRSRR